MLAVSPFVLDLAGAAMTDDSYPKVSISELCGNAEAIIEEAASAPVAIINGRGVTAYLVPADIFEALMDGIEDAELRELVNERRGEATIKVELAEL
jgi:antitoxin StbD